MTNLTNLVFKELEDIKQIFSLNFLEQSKNFFKDQLNNILPLINSQNIKVFYLENEEKQVLAVFIISFLDKQTIQISFYAIEPTIDEVNILNIVSLFLDFLEDYCKKNNIKTIFAGVDYYNDDLFEKMIEKGFIAISYKMMKEIK